MKANIKLLASYGFLFQTIVALQPSHESYVTVINRVNLAVRQGLRIAAVVPTESGQIGINPPKVEPTPANIEGHTKYLTQQGGTTKWIGVDPVNIQVKTTTTTKKGGATAVATITKGVSASKNAAGGLDILLSPGVKDKLEAIAKQVKPCVAPHKRSRRSKMHTRGGAACGLADFVERVGADPELQANFADPLTDQVWNEIDEGYHGDPSQDGGWEGDGGHHVPGEDEGYFSDDGEGFYEGATGGEADSTVETIVIAAEEEAAAIGAGLSGGEAVVDGAVWGGSTVAAGSFLAWLWGTLKDGKPIPYANSIPKESIHKVTKTKTKTQSKTTSTSSSSSCPTSAPACGDCVPTSTQVVIPSVTGVVNWLCSTGARKGCKCSPDVEERIDNWDTNFHQAILEAVQAIGNEPKTAKAECPGAISPAPSKFFLDETAKGFCQDVMKNLNANNGPTAYDIHGNKIPILKAVKAIEQSKRNIGKRSPPENADNYKDYKFFLQYTHQQGDCLIAQGDLCRSAYDALVKSNCGNNHGSAGDRMFVDASIDVGCGKFSWHVEVPPPNLNPPPPAPAPSLSTRTCHDKHRHDDVHENQQQAWATYGCKWFAAGKTMKMGDKEVYWHPVGSPDINSNFKISWIDGCKTNVAEQSLEFPIESDHGINCVGLLTGDYKDCNNGGAGGSIDAGCLRYDFWAQ